MSVFQNQSKQFFTVGLLGALSVALGALGAHTLKNQLPGGLITLDQLDGFDKAARYQMYHVLAMLAVLLINKEDNYKLLKWAYRCFLIGIVLFSGSLYFLTTRNLIGIEGLKVLGPVTPLGGLFFIAGWLLLGLQGLKKR